MPRCLINFVVVSTLIKVADVNPRVSDSCPIEPTRHVYQSIFCQILNITYNTTTLYTVESRPGWVSVHCYDHGQTVFGSSMHLVLFPCLFFFPFFVSFCFNLFV